MPTFVRRFLDQEHSSICKICFRTIAKSKTQEDLAEKEYRHVCDAEDLRRLYSKRHRRRFTDTEYRVENIA